VRTKAATQDAQLILQLVRVRRDAEMCKARLWWHNRFWPKNAEDYLKVETALGTRENIWLRQVVSYWGMAASFVLNGTLSEQAFLNPTFSGEMFAVFSKVRPFLSELRKRMQKPEFLGSVESVIANSKKARTLLRVASKRLAARHKIAVRHTAKPSTQDRSTSASQSSTPIRSAR
jgi:hypothetical protein